MIVSDLLQNEKFKSVSLPCGEREINGVYIGDLLSWVMGRASCDDAWITIMTNVNILAVSSLADTSCIILAEGVMPEQNIVDTAVQKGINILSSEMSAYEIAVFLSNAI